MKIYSTAFFRSAASAYESERAGAGRGVFFVNYLRSLVRAFWMVYGPDNWKLMIQHDDRAMEFPYFQVLKRMQEKQLLTLYYRGKSEGLCSSMMWRLNPIWYVDSEYVLCRDLDALPTYREKRRVDNWIQGGKAIHALHDSISHMGTMLMGGMVGFDVKQVKDKIPKPPTEGLNVHGDDQRWLNEFVAPYHEIQWDGPVELGPKDHPMDKLGSHLGGAFHVDPFVKWLDENPDLCPKLEIIRECEK